MIKIYVANESEYEDSEFLDNPLRGSLEIYLSLEDKKGRVYSYKQASRIVSKYFAGATIYLSKGLWERKLEKGVVIMIVNDDNKMNWVKFKVIGEKLIAELQKRFNQDAVMYKFTTPKYAKYNLYFRK